MKKQLINLLCIASIAFGSASCDFLDVVPDNVATIENAFANELEARKYLATIYSYLPHHDKFNNNIALMGSDEITSWHILTLDNQITPIRAGHRRPEPQLPDPELLERRQQRTQLP